MKNMLVLLALLCACAPRQMTADENSVSFIVKTGLITSNADDAQERANSHCARYQKKASLRSMNEVARNRTVAVFECK